MTNGDRVPLGERNKKKERETGKVKTRREKTYMKIGQREKTIE